MTIKAGRLMIWAAGVASLAGNVLRAQDAQMGGSGSTAMGNASAMLEKVGGSGTVIVILVAIVLVVAIVMFLKRDRAPWETEYSEPELPSSRFEQLLAEIQGLALRLQGGESRGYYKKIETLARIYLERSGFPGARQMTDAEIAKILTGNHLPQNFATALSSIMERSRQGSQHENEKLDFSADELLRDLNALIKQTEAGVGSPKHA